MEIPETPDGHIILRLSDLSDQDMLHGIKELLSANPGPAEAYILVGDDDPKKIRLPFKVTITRELIASLGELIGSGRVTHAAATT